MLNVNVPELFDKIVENVSIEEVSARIDELKDEYVWGWEDEFDNIHDAYAEQGRGEAEAEFLSQVISEYAPFEINTSDYLQLYDMLLERWEIGD